MRRFRFEELIALALIGILGFSVTAVPLAMVGRFRPLPVFALAAALSALLWGLWRRGRSDSVAAGNTPATTVVVIIALVITGVNVRFSSQHLLTERDPGVYVTTAQWLADRGTLLIDPQGEVYAGLPNEHRVHFRAAGYYEDHREDGKLYAQFPHLLPAMLAAGSWLAGSRGMLKVNALLGGLALLVFFAFASKLIPPWLAVVATAALGVNLTQAHFSRDAYTEVVAQLLIFGGLWALWTARTRLDAARAVIAGLLFGATCMVRVDSFALLVPLTAYVTFELLSASGQGEVRKVRRFVTAFGLGVAATALLGWLEVRLFSPIYLHDLRRSTQIIWELLALAVIGGAILVVLRARLARVAAWLKSHRRWLGYAAVLAIVIGALYAYVLRPQLEVGYQGSKGALVEGLQRRAGLPMDPKRSYVELLFRWIGMYVGLPALALGVAGFAYMLRETVLGRLQRAVPFLLALGAVSAAVLWRPEVTPDHIWTMRRFVPVVIPGLIICCFWTVGRVLAFEGRPRLPDLWRNLAIASAAAVIGHSAWTLIPVISERMHVGTLLATERLCDYLPERAAVLVAQSALLDLQFTQTVRGFCRVPAANAPMDQPMDWYREIARRWAARGHSLYVVSPRPHFGEHWPESSTHVASVDYRNLERTLLGVPRGYELYTFQLYVRKVLP